MQYHNSGRCDAFEERFTVYAGEDMGGAWGGNPRSEKSADHAPLEFETDYVWEFDLDLPDWPYLPSWCLHFQAHGRPDQGEANRSPCLALESGKGIYTIKVRAKENEVVYQQQVPFTECSRWRIETKFSISPDRGYTRVIKDGVLVAEYYGENCYDDALPPYLKWGIYMSSSNPPHFGKLTALFRRMSPFR